ncbi:ventricular zone-expressed PH domain-containing protein-like [Sinocyclocheilus rhinocerous]|uniref:ventricular zone-expressed PH domain-containing protein-like n=1 Tax=Sinocyclocheilus rhinocerous TaxID=307959 RepID=UPI0007B9967B|nr:PREDICTED: ventricular zone-expressed PH domain-containing protein-like [Sinocyclocheilus rhinocerous]
MHQLFRLVLGQRDLSRAGDLFSLDDSEIEDCLSQALEEIKVISCSPDYLTNDNDQAVVEICITRITTAIRETGSIERHGAALVSLWESCLEHNLQPQGKDEDTPHAKIASDITSCILQTFRLMAEGLDSISTFIGQDPPKRPSERHVKQPVTNGTSNAMLLRVLPSVYPRQPEPIHQHIRELTAMMSQVDQAGRQHLLRLLQMISEHHPLVLSSLVPSLIVYISDSDLSDTALSVLVNVAQASPASLVPFLSTLRNVGQKNPWLLGHIAKIHGAVGLTSEVQAHGALQYLVSLLASMEHSAHHTLLLEIHCLTDRYTSILGGGVKDIYRMSNSFTAIARLLGRKLEAESTFSREEEKVQDLSRPCEAESSSDMFAENQRLQVKIQAFEQKMGDEVEEFEEEGASPGPQRRHSLGQAARDERREMRFSRSKSLALHAVRTRSINSDSSPEGEGLDLSTELGVCEASPSPETRPALTTLQENHKLTETQPDTSPNSEGQKVVVGDPREGDRLWIHLRDNMEEIKTFCAEMIKQIPIPEHCVIEDSHRGCVAKLSFSCPLKGHYCLYGKSCFSLCSRQPHLWIQIMLLALQSKVSEALCCQDECVKQLRKLWEKTQLTGAHSFELAMTQATVPHKKDVDSLQMYLEEVRFFDLFSYSEEEGGWLCFMCSNPEKATVVNQDGQPLIEGKLKEKQVRWKFIKRWKTRYFTLAGNQLLFRRGKSKDELDNSTIELSKVQSR